jgi:dTDP-4-dehydrorhamnose reductase
MTLLITGCTGILGQAVTRRAQEQGIAFVTTFHRRRPVLEPVDYEALPLDITQEGDVFALFNRVRPRAVINCAGLTKALCGDVARAWLVNAVAPRLLLAASERVAARMVQVSTDCVFSGAHGPYDEQSPPDPTDAYGQAKLAGETVESPHLTVRSSFIGDESGTRHGLLAWFLAQSGEITGFRNHLWSGLTALELARVLLALAADEDVTGLVHVHGEDTSKSELLRMLQRAYGTDVDIVDAEPEPAIDRRLRSIRADELDLAAPPLETMIEEMAHATPGQIFVPPM